MLKKIAVSSMIFVGMLLASPTEIPLGAREQGMGGACVALSGDALSIYWNPAGIVNVNGSQILATHWQWQEIKDIMIDYVGFVHTLQLGEGKLGIGIGLVSRAAKLEEGNPTYGLDRSSLFLENTFEVAGAFSIFRFLNIGLTLDRHWIYSTIGGKTGIGFNLGFNGEIYGTEDYHVYYGLLFRNIFAGYGDEKVYPQARLGFGFVGFPIREGNEIVAHYVKFAVDLAEKEDIQGKKGVSFHYYAGLEITPYYKYVSLRLGYNDLYMYSGGIGINYKNFGIDYAYSGGNEIFGDAHRIAFYYSF